MKTLTAAVLTMVISLSFLPQHKAEAQSKLYDAAKLRKVDQMIEKDIAAGFPGAVLIVVKDGRVIKKKAYGYSKNMTGTPFYPVRKNENINHV